MPTKLCLSSLLFFFFLGAYFLLSYDRFIFSLLERVLVVKPMASPPIIPKWLLIDPDSFLCHISKNTRKRVHWLNWQQGAVPSPINNRFSNGFCSDVLKLLFAFLHLEMKEKFIISDSSFFCVGGYVSDGWSHK